MDDVILFNVFGACMIALLFAGAWLVHDVFEEKISRKYSSFGRWINGDKSGSEKDSNFRRGLTVVISVLSYIIVVRAIGEHLFYTKTTRPDYDLYLSMAMCLIPIGYFIYVVLLTPFRTSDSFEVNPSRLAHNALISVIGFICFFSVFFGEHGVSIGNSCSEDNSLLESMYFSAVTFSTLGYGDIAPCKGLGRFMASILAVFGNIHLGVFVAAIFLAAKDSKN